MACFAGNIGERSSLANQRIVNEPTTVLTSVPGGRAVLGRGWPLLATVHMPVADGQVKHPVLLQTPIEPSGFTAHEQRAPVAVLSIHLPTAVLPSMALEIVNEPAGLSGIVNEPTAVLTSVPGGRAMRGRGSPLLAGTHS